MKKLFYLFILTASISACKDKEVSTEMRGHWMQKEFFNDVQAKKNLAEITAPKLEFIITSDDTNYIYITYGKKPATGQLEPYKKNHSVIKDYYGNNHNADIILKNNELHFVNSFTQEEIVFVKIDDSYKPNTGSEYESYSIPFIHHQYISGTYKMDSIEVKFVDQGKLKGLGNLENYSLCYDASCRNGNSNAIFLSDKNYEGYYYDFETRNDSLIIYDVDRMAIARGMKSDRMGVKYALKKIN